MLAVNFSLKVKGNKEKGEVVFKGEKDCDSFKKRRLLRENVPVRQRLRQK